MAGERKRLLDQGAGGAFNAAVKTYLPRGHIYELSLDGGLQAVFTRSDNHLNKATRGTWQDVKIRTPEGTSQFENLDALQKRTQALMEGNHPYAPMFEKVVQTYKTLNTQTRPSQQFRR